MLVFSGTLLQAYKVSRPVLVKESPTEFIEMMMRKKKMAHEDWQQLIAYMARQIQNVDIMRLPRKTNGEIDSDKVVKQYSVWYAVTNNLYFLVSQFKLSDELIKKTRTLNNLVRTAYDYRFINIGDDFDFNEYAEKMAILFEPEKFARLKSVFRSKSVKLVDDFVRQCFGLLLKAPSAV